MIGRTAQPRGGESQQGPVIVLAYAQAGAAQLQRMLARDAALACTSGTGVLPLCDLAAATWRQVDNRGGPLSGLAAASIRSMANSVITVILARAGKSRWCEASFAPASRAEAFLELYPATKFICLHRCCLDVIIAGLQANPWGPADTPFGPYAAAYPGNSLATMAAYWTSSTEALLQFQETHPAACCRLRYEDLIGNADAMPSEIATFLDLGPPDPSAPPWNRDQTPPQVDQVDQLPVDRIPLPLRTMINDLQKRLGYPPLT